MQLWTQQALIGLTNGMVFALIALGYSLVYSVLGIINFAHGDVFMLASLVALVLMGAVPEAVWQGALMWPTLLAVTLLTASFAAALNWSLDRLVFRAIRKHHKLTPLVSAIGISLVLQNVGLLLGALPLAVFAGGHSAAAPKAFLQPLSAQSLLPASFGVHISARECLALASTAVALLLLVFLVQKTRMGRAMRAVAQDPLAASLMGVRASHVTGMAFAIGGALAGVAAVVYGLFIGTVHYQMGFQNGLYAFVAAVLGGIGSIVGAVLGGLVIGLARAACDQWLGSQWQPAVIFGLLVLMLLLRPQGLLGARGAEKV